MMKIVTGLSFVMAVSKNSVSAAMSIRFIIVRLLIGYKDNTNAGNYKTIRHFFEQNFEVSYKTLSISTLLHPSTWCRSEHRISNNFPMSAFSTTNTTNLSVVPQLTDNFLHTTF